jgi:hypothetical protein
VGGEAHRPPEAVGLLEHRHRVEPEGAGDAGGVDQAVVEREGLDVP